MNARTLPQFLVATPIGTLRVSVSDRGIARVEPARGSASRSPSSRSASVRRCRRQLDEYFAGRGTRFSLPLDAEGTPFQRKVWQALRRVPFGTTVTYGELARRIGAPLSVRATASAVGKNPLAVIIPCHRVVPASGALPGGYAWGARRKTWLLRHEARES